MESKVTSKKSCIEFITKFNCQTIHINGDENQIDGQNIITITVDNKIIVIESLSNWRNAMDSPFFCKKKVFIPRGSKVKICLKINGNNTYSIILAQ